MSLLASPALPNALTLFRAGAAIPIALLVVAEARGLAFVLFVLACLSDYFDGALARRHGHVSRWGTILDPVADKVLILATGLVLTAAGPLGGWAVVPLFLILLREVAIGGLREGLATGPATTALPVSRGGKWKTTLQMLAAGFTLPFAVWPGGVLDWGLALLWWGAAGLTVATGLDYAALALRPPRA